MTPAASVFITLGKHVYSSVVNFTGVPGNLHSLQLLAWGGGGGGVIMLPSKLFVFF